MTAPIASFQLHRARTSAHVVSAAHTANVVGTAHGAYSEAPLTSAHAPDPHRGGLPPALLSRELVRAQKLVSDVVTRGLPQDAPALVAAYEALGKATSSALAVLWSALDALDQKTGGGVAKDPQPFAELRARAFALLNQTGAAFAHLEPAFAAIVHAPTKAGGGGWASRPVVVEPDRGDGIPLRIYENSYKKDRALSLEERQSEYAQRVDKFTRAGGRFEDIIVAKDATTFAQLEALVPYDYVVDEHGTTRMFPTLDTDPSAAKPGHTLLATGRAEFSDVRALLAGELWVLKDTAGDVEAVLVANNSGHFKPKYEDLANIFTALEELGIPREKVVLFGGPNNVPAMFAEMSAKMPALGDLSARLPPSPADVLAALKADPGTKPHVLRGAN